MKIIKAFPPNYIEIKKNFQLPGNAAGIAFAWGDKIYAPRCGIIAPEILEHEKAHGVRQLAMGVEVWWERYIRDLLFRLDEEIIGHRAELANIISRLPNQGTNTWGQPVERIARKLASPIYGRLISYDDALAELSKPA